MAYGNDSGLVLIDIIQKSVLLSMASADLYSSADPYTRLPRSPKRPTGDAAQATVSGSGINRTEQASDDQSCRSPSYDPQVPRKFLSLMLSLCFFFFGLSIDFQRERMARRDIFSIVFFSFSLLYYRKL